MAVRKTTRSNPQAQPQPQQQRRPDPQLKAEIFETLRHINRGYGVALAALHRLETKDRYTARIFPAGLVHDYRNRTEVLRAQANQKLLHLIAKREEQEAEHLVRLSDRPAKPAGRRRK